ncbi:MAG: hypothetical protein Pg6C_11690 [Treponemataceae bacterium]|nr:MAG: hypothetical protein Pg6C_11690 [Treponemataceae bacterium]
MDSKDFEKMYYETRPLMIFAEILIAYRGKAVIKQVLKEIPLPWESED